MQAVNWMIDACVVDWKNVPQMDSLVRGGIVGRAKIIDVIPPGDSTYVLPPGVDRRWHMREQYGFILDNVEPLPFFACNGALGLFNMPDNYAAEASV